MLALVGVGIEGALAPGPVNVTLDDIKQRARMTGLHTCFDRVVFGMDVRCNIKTNRRRLAELQPCWLNLVATVRTRSSASSSVARDAPMWPLRVVGSLASTMAGY